jgi:hypothetical protein
VEDTFQFQLPDHVAVSSDEDRKVGEGCYVSATVHNRRYYGVLIDQESLRAASMLYFQDEASGLELNRKMEHLYSLKTQSEGVDNKRTADDAVMDESDTSAKRARHNIVPDGPVRSELMNSMKQIKSNRQMVDDTRAVQKFRFVPPSNKHNDVKSTQTSGYRILLATYVDVTAAADDDPDRKQLIEAACHSGGNFVGEYYYQYEVRNLKLFTF